MLQWILGEKRYVYINVTAASGETFTIDSATYLVYNVSDGSTVASGTASINGHTCYAAFEPSEVGVYCAHFDYTIGAVNMSSRQIIDVKETM